MLTKVVTVRILVKLRTSPVMTSKYIHLQKKQSFESLKLSGWSWIVDIFIAWRNTCSSNEIFWTHTGHACEDDVILYED